MRARKATDPDRPGEIDKEANMAREALRAWVAALAVTGASKILSREVDAEAHAKMLDE